MRGYVVKSNREAKAKKILSILSDFLGKDIINLRILDIGAGSGLIGYYIEQRGNEVYLVDVEDQRIEECKKQMNSSNFFKVNNEKLPFKDGFFDIVISNHVIEHMPDQILHLKEIYRVLRQNGVCYVATPNKFFFKEVHTNTYFIHWFKNKIFFKLLKILGKYKEDIYLLNYFQMKKYFNATGFFYHEYTSKVLNNTKKYNLDIKISILYFPDFLQFIAPTNIFLLKK